MAIVASEMSSKDDRYISPARASQILSRALGHGYSRQSIVRLLESGTLVGHQMTPRGRWWILSSSLRVYIQEILGCSDGMGSIAQLVTIGQDLRRRM
jgi:hypothetical protein